MGTVGSSLSSSKQADLPPNSGIIEPISPGIRRTNSGRTDPKRPKSQATPQPQAEAVSPTTTPERAYAKRRSIGLRIQEVFKPSSTCSLLRCCGGRHAAYYGQSIPMLWSMDSAESGRAAAKRSKGRGTEEDVTCTENTTDPGSGSSTNNNLTQPGCERQSCPPLEDPPASIGNKHVHDTGSSCTILPMTGSVDSPRPIIVGDAEDSAPALSEDADTDSTGLPGVAFNFEADTDSTGLPGGAFNFEEIKIPHQGSSLSSVVADAHIADLGAKVRRHSPNPVTEIEFSDDCTSLSDDEEQSPYAYGHQSSGPEYELAKNQSEDDNCTSLSDDGSHRTNSEFTMTAVKRLPLTHADAAGVTFKRLPVTPLEIPTTAQPPLQETERRAKKLEAQSQLCSEVLPSLFVSGVQVAQDENILRAHNITAVVNCAALSVPNYFSDISLPQLSSKETPQAPGSTDSKRSTLRLRYLSLKMLDAVESDEDLHWFLETVIGFIAKEIDDHAGNVLIHCIQGVSRSCSLAIAYMMWKFGRSYAEAFRVVKAKRLVCSPNLAFATHLVQWDRLRVKAHPGRLYRLASHGHHDPGTFVPKLCRQQRYEVLVTPSYRELDPRFIFVVVRPHLIAVWIGGEISEREVMDSRSEHESLASSFATTLLRLESQSGDRRRKEIAIVRQGEETPSFWAAVCGQPACCIRRNVRYDDDVVKRPIPAETAALPSCVLATPPTQPFQHSCAGFYNSITLKSTEGSNESPGISRESGMDLPLMTPRGHGEGNAANNMSSSSCAYSPRSDHTEGSASWGSPGCEVFILTELTAQPPLPPPELDGPGASCPPLPPRLGRAWEKIFHYDPLVLTSECVVFLFVHSSSSSSRATSSSIITPPIDSAPSPVCDAHGGDGGGGGGALVPQQQGFFKTDDDDDYDLDAEHPPAALADDKDEVSSSNRQLHSIANPRMGHMSHTVEADDLVVHHQPVKFGPQILEAREMSIQDNTPHFIWIGRKAEVATRQQIGNEKNDEALCLEEHLNMLVRTLPGLPFSTGGAAMSDNDSGDDNSSRQSQRDGDSNSISATVSTGGWRVEHEGRESEDFWDAFEVGY